MTDSCSKYLPWVTAKDGTAMKKLDLVGEA